jgi:hypothetical protein
MTDVVWQSHDDLAELDKKCSLQWFREKICHHVLGGTILNGYAFAANVVSHKVVSNLQVSCVLAAGLASVLSKQHGALVILINHVVGYFHSLSLKEEARP